VIRDLCLNEAVWFFSFRYWAISFVMPWQLKGIKVPNWYKILALITFFTGVILNAVFPFLYNYYGKRLNNSLKDPVDRARVYDEIHE
jgi:hypothetical protein